MMDPNLKTLKAQTKRVNPEAWKTLRKIAIDLGVNVERAFEVVIREYGKKREQRTDQIPDDAEFLVDATHGHHFHTERCPLTIHSPFGAYSKFQYSWIREMLTRDGDHFMKCKCVEDATHKPSNLPNDGGEEPEK